MSFGGTSANITKKNVCHHLYLYSWAHQYFHSVAKKKRDSYIETGYCRWFRYAVSCDDAFLIVKSIYCTKAWRHVDGGKEKLSGCRPRVDPCRPRRDVVLRRHWPTYALLSVSCMNCTLKCVALPNFIAASSFIAAMKSAHIRYNGVNVAPHPGALWSCAML